MRRYVLAVGLAGLVGCNGNGDHTGDGAVPDGSGKENTSALCHDGEDNDGDSKKDCADPDCAAFCVDGGSDASDGPSNPGCPQGCGSGEVCLRVEGAWKCVTAGPSKSCGSSKYGEGLPATGVLYVDGSHTGSSDGSQSQPYKTIGEALAATGGSGAASTIAVASGTYAEDLSVEASVTVACRCPEGQDAAVIEGEIAVTSVTSADIKVIIDGCTIRGAGGCTGSLTPRGVSVTSTGAAVSLLLRHSVIEGFCAGLHYSVPRTSPPAPLCVSRSRLSNNVAGIWVTEATSSFSAAQSWEAGDCDGVTQSVAVERSSVSDNEAGIYAAGGARELALRGNRVTNNRATSHPNMRGIGVVLANAVDALVESNVIENNGAQGLGVKNLETMPNSRISIASNRLVGNSIAGIHLENLQSAQRVSLTDNLVKGTSASSGQYGDGIVITVGGGASYDVDVKTNRVEGSARHGIVLDGVGGSVDGNTVTSSGGYGIVLQKSTTTVGSNDYSGNAGGDEHSYSSPVVEIGGMPFPLP